MIAEADNPIGAQAGDFVKVATSSGQILGMAALVYLMPLVLFFAGYAIGDALAQMGALFGCLFFVASIGLAVLYDRKVVKKQNTGYTITGFAGK